MGTLSRLTTGRPQRVLLVGFQDQDNLGLGYLASAVAAAGHRAAVVTYQSDPAALLEHIRAEAPDLVGFSLIFQYMAPDFARVIRALREAGVRAHVTMGGHYPSFDYAEVLTRMPGLDSVVRFEGESTFVELLHRMAAGEDWRQIDGVAYRLEDGTVRANRIRAAVADLDELPWPDRSRIVYEAFPLSTASILGSRGCPWKCSFCSIRPFYESQGGELRRLRRPERVVDEMIDLFETRSVAIFLFQDDDFLASGRRAREWAGAIADLLRARGFAGRIAFKISCRSDEIEEAVMRRLMAGGLTHVYMGVEAGDDAGLSHMNKMIRPATHLRAGRILRSLGLSFDFGFMLMEPWSTFDSIRTNIDFLEEFAGDGWSVAPFCRMLPYAGTPVRRQLAEEGRLLGTPFAPDYRFLDPRLDLFYDWLLATFQQRNFTSEGLCHALRYSLFEARLRLPAANRVTAAERLEIQRITAVCNRIACGTLRAALDHVERTPLAELERDRELLDGLMALERREEARLAAELASCRRTIEARPLAPSDGAWSGDHVAQPPLGGDRLEPRRVAL
jgi:radical SAM superfamily enzyme YgiQ (UPF0313 family)